MKRHIAPTEYRPGHFTELMRKPSKAHAAGFPPRFVPQYQPTRVNASGQTMAEVSTANRERLLDRGITGTIVGLGKVAHSNETWRAKVAR